MFVNKRNGSRQEINVSKIQSKIQFFTDYIFTLNKVDVAAITEQVKLGLHDGVSTSELDVYTARRCMEMETSEPQYGTLAIRILINNHHKNTLTSFKDKMEKLYRRMDNTGKSHPFLDKTFYKFVCTNQRSIEAMIDYQRDYLLDTFGFSTLEQQYINRIDGKCVERPQDLFMKEAICLCMNTEDFTDETALKEIHLLYDLLSTQKFTYATPTLNNSGMLTQQLSSCFLLGTEDTLEGINKTLDDAAKISKFGGGIGIHVSNIRSAGQLIRGTNGKSSGIINFLRMYGMGADAYNQGGKRKGSFAIFLRDYHPDFLEFIQLKNPIGDESQRARSLFLCAALSDLFWRAVETDSMWYFVDPEEYRDIDDKNLDELYGEEFDNVMTDLINKKKFKKTMKARDVLKEIMKQQFESGVPYIINIDAVNRKNNLKHYSTIRSSNLCVEITLPSSATEYGVCNLASIVLPSYVTDTPSNGDLEVLRKPIYKRSVMTNPVFDFLGLSKVVQILTKTMDRVIDRSAYPVKEAMLSNLLHRPVGIGCSGLADTCCLLRVPYDSKEGVKLSGYIAETIAFSAYSESTLLAKTLGSKLSVSDQKSTTAQIFEIYEESKRYSELSTQMAKLARTTDIDSDEYTALENERRNYSENPCIAIIPLAKKLGVYPSYHFGTGAPISQGEFQWKMWGLKPDQLSGMWDWGTLEAHIKRFGIRNSLLTAQMPTATTAQIMAVNEGIEPFTTNMYRRAVLSGEFVVFNKYLVRDLISIGLWNDDMKNYLIASGGSIQHITGIPQELKDLYKTAWDMGQKIGVEHAVARGPFLDHSQSFNVFIGNSTDEDQRAEKLYRTLYYGWKQGLKTGIYYLRTQPAIKAQQFSIPLESLAMVGEMRKFSSSVTLPPVTEEQGCLLCGT
jgi:ribonucleoside-diphosphate reductase alpha subunit